MRIRFLTQVLSGTIVFVGCDAGAPVAPETVLLHAAAANPVVLSASGGGQFTNFMGDQTLFTFHAKKRADGTDNGKVKFSGLRGDVTCVESLVDGTVAMGTDVPRPDNLPPIAGPFFMLFVRDHGEGANAPPDQIFGDFVPLFAYDPELPPDVDPADICQFATVPPGFLFADIDGGNIQVKP